MKRYGVIMLTFFIAAPAYAQYTAAQPVTPVATPAAPALASAPAQTKAVQTKVTSTQSTQTLPKDPKHDTSLPVEITSDSLEVLQHENRAIFKGNVVAVQGDIRLKSDIMIVHYKQHGADDAAAKPSGTPAAPKPTPASGSQAPGDMGAITLIEVQGNVFMATPQESAKGDNGNYDVPTRMLHLYGSNVVLTRDKNIMRGTALEYNMETGRSILTNIPDEKGKATGDGRVRSVFVPNKAQNQPAATSSNTTASPAPTPVPIPQPLPPAAAGVR